MSSAKRRLKRKASILARMDATHHRCQMPHGLDSWDRETDPFTRSRKASRISANMRALGKGRYFQGAKARQRAATVVIQAQRTLHRRGAQ